jgi:hypothetical protein
MFCLRVTALYKGVRWVVWPVWIAFVAFHGIRMIIAIRGMAIIACEWIHHQDPLG